MGGVMSSWSIIYNPNCSKSRKALQILREHKINPTIIDYLQNPLSREQLSDIADKIGVEAHQLLRKKEKAFVEANIDVTNDMNVFDAMVDNPSLIERPIVVHKEKALIARPPEKLLDII